MDFQFIKRTTLILIVAFLGACSQQYDFGIPDESQEFPSNVIYNNKLDLVFIVDDSKTMKGPQEKLSSTIPGMIQALLSLKMDMHIVVISTSMGGATIVGGEFLGSPKILTNSTPNLASVLANRLRLGEGGRDREAGLESLVTVLNPKYLNNQGVGFFRDESLLSVIAITNEDDHSGLGPVDYYVAFLDAIKKRFDSGERAWAVNIIGVTDPSGKCLTEPDSNYSEMAKLYMDLADISGGTKSSICSSDLTGAVSNIHRRIAQILSDFKLNREPDVSTIRVTVNGRAVPRSNVDGWDYIASQNIIRFYGSWIPAADSAISINFTPAKPD